MNKGVFNGTREYEQYMIDKGFRGNMQRIAERCGDNVTLYNLISRKAVEPVTKKHEELAEKLSHGQQGTDEEILDEFKDVGTQAAEVKEPGQEPEQSADN